MAKELPYFRFTASEWLNDDISLEEYETKGVFIDVCAFYWFKDCSINLALLEKRFKGAVGILKQLVDLDVITLNNDESITIKFLDEQYDMLSEKRKKRSKAGRAGGLKKSSNAKANVKQISTYKDKENNKDKIIEGNGKSVTPPKPSNIVFPPDITELLIRVKGLFDPKLVDTKAKCEKWMNTVRLLNEKDGHSFEEIEDVITFGRTDNFWGSNFLSIQSLRSKRKGDDVMKYDKIFAQMKSEAGNGAQKFSPNKLGTTSAIGKSGTSRFKAKKLG